MIVKRHDFEPLRAALISAEALRESVISAHTHLQWWRLFYFEESGWRVRRADGADAWLAVPAGVAVLAPARLSVEVEHTGGKAGRLWLLLFDPQADLSTARFFPQGPDAIRIRDTNGVICRFCRRMVQLLQLPGATGHGAEAALLMTRLLGILEHAEAIAPGIFGLPVGYIPPDTDTFAADVAAYMNEHLAQRLNRRQLARHLHMSVSSLAHRYSEETRETLGQTLLRLRMAAARTLLRSDLPIDAVAAQCGFTDRYQFSRRFRQTEGISPAAFRKLHAALPGTGDPAVRQARPAEEPPRPGATTTPSVPTILGQQSVEKLDPRLRVNLNFWILDYFYTSGVRIRVRGGPARGMEFPACTARLYRPNADIREDSSHADRPIRGAWIGFHPAPHWNLDRFYSPGRYDAVFLDRSGYLGRTLARINQQAGPDPAIGQRMTLAPQLDAMLEHLFRAVPGERTGEFILPTEPDCMDSGPIVEKARRFLQTHLHQTLRMADVAAAAGVSVKDLLRLYRQATGETPLAAIQRFRVLWAKRLLADGASLKEAADQAGFANPAHFSRRFKQIEGISPSTFVAAVRSR